VTWPLFRSLRGYRRSWLRGDVVAGLTVWAVPVPRRWALPRSPGCHRWWGCTRPRRRCCGPGRGLLRRLAPVVPGSLVAVLFGIVVVWALGLDDRGVDIVGHIDSGRPALGPPDVAAADYLALARSVLGQVRDVLRRTEGERLPLSAYPAVREAIEALTPRP
jgi:hypothetical protein